MPFPAQVAGWGTRGISPLLLTVWEDPGVGTLALASGLGRMAGDTPRCSPVTLLLRCQQPSNLAVMVEAQASHPVIKVL